MKREIEGHGAKPLIAFFLKPSAFIEGFIHDAEQTDRSRYDFDRDMSVFEDGSPTWHTAAYKLPPTNCYTPGKVIPAGYTKSGKYKPSRYSPSKSTDKRVGK